MNYIKYDGKKIPVKFSYRVIKNVKDQFGVDLVLSDESLREWFDSFSNLEKVFFEMVKEGCRQEKLPCEFTLEDMEDILSAESVYADFLVIYGKDVINFMTPSSAKNKKKEKETLKEA